MRRPNIGLLVLLPFAASAEPAPQLRGLQTVNIDVVLNEEGKTCGLTNAMISEGMLLPLRAYTKLRQRPSGESADALVTISINAVHDAVRKQCAASIIVSVYSQAVVQLSFQPQPVPQAVVMWSVGSPALYSVGNAETVIKGVESIARGLASDWQEANQ